MSPSIFPYLSPLIHIMTKILSVIQDVEVSEEETDVSRAVSQTTREDLALVGEMETGEEGICRAMVMTVATRKA